MDFAHVILLFMIIIWLPVLIAFAVSGVVFVADMLTRISGSRILERCAFVLNYKYKSFIYYKRVKFNKITSIYFNIAAALSYILLAVIFIYK